MFGACELDFVQPGRDFVTCNQYCVVVIPRSPNFNHFLSAGLSPHRSTLFDLKITRLDQFRALNFLARFERVLDCRLVRLDNRFGAQELFG